MRRGSCVGSRFKRAGVSARFFSTLPLKRKSRLAQVRAQPLLRHFFIIFVPSAHTLVQNTALGFSLFPPQ